MRSLIVLVLSVVLAWGIAAATSLSLLPPVGASLTFAVSSHTDTPFHNHGDSHGHGGFHGGGSGSGPSGDPSASGFADFLRDKSGTYTLSRTSSGVKVTTSGDVDSFNSPLAITGQSTVDPGSLPDRFIVAFDNATALAAGMHAQVALNDSWSATVQLLMGPDTLQGLPVNVKVMSVNGNDVAMEGTGQGNFTLSTPMGDQPVSVNATVDADIVAGKLHAYSQKVVQTMTMQDRSVIITTTTSLTSQ